MNALSSLKSAAIVGVACLAPLFASAQGATDLYQISQTDLRGTARYEAMAGAFGALGGDISTLIQNPGGIGIYRSCDVAVTIDLDLQKTYLDVTSPTKQTKFNCNNFGYVGSFKTNSETMPFFNFGISYNRKASFNRHYYATDVPIATSLTNHIANGTDGWPVAEIEHDAIYKNPYTEGTAPWMSILAYDAYLINPTSERSYQGLAGAYTVGLAETEVIETGGIDEFNLSFGGNIRNIVYWGVSLGLNTVKYDRYNFHGELLDNAEIWDNVNQEYVTAPAAFAIENKLHTQGTGLNGKFGVIVRPTDALRLGAAIHTPTYFNLRDDYFTSANYDFGDYGNGRAQTNDGYDGQTWYKLRTPLKYIFSAALVHQLGLISFDYEGTNYSGMKMKDDRGVDMVEVNDDVKNYYQTSHTFRIGAEYRLSPKWSIRAGYSYQTSPMKKDMIDGRLTVYTASTTPAYIVDNNIQYITCGLGYKYRNVYFDLAYVHKTRNGDYRMWDTMDGGPVMKLTDHNNRIAATLGFRF